MTHYPQQTLTTTENGSHSDGSPLSGKQNGNNDLLWRKRTIWRKIYNVDRCIYRQYAAIDTPCEWIVYSFPSSFLFLSLAFKCPFLFSPSFYSYHSLLKMRRFAGPAGYYLYTIAPSNSKRKNIYTNTLTKYSKQKVLFILLLILVVCQSKNAVKVIESQIKTHTEKYKYKHL